MAAPTRNRPSIFRRLFVSSATTAVYRVGALAVTLFLTPFLIGALGQRTYGLVVLLNVFTVAGYGSLADLGLASAVVKFSAQYGAPEQRQERDRLLGTSCLIYAAIGAGVAVLTLAAGSLIISHVFRLSLAEQRVALVLIRIVAITLVVDFMGVWLSAVLEGVQRYDIINTIQLARTVLVAALIVAAVHAGFGARGWLWSVAIGSAAATLVMYIAVQRVAHWSLRRLVFHAPVLRHVWSFSAKVFALRVMGVLYATVDRMVLGSFRTVNAIAGYDVANKVHNLGLVPISFTTAMAVPAASDLEARGRNDHLRELFLRGTLYTVAISLPAIVGLLALAPYLLESWVGPQFLGQTGTVLLFVSYLLVWCLPQVGWNMMVGMGRSGRLLPVSVVTISLNLLLSVALAPRFGVAGVVGATVVGNAVAVPWYLVIVMRELDVSWRDFASIVLLRTYPAAALVGSALYAATSKWPPSSLWSVGAWLAATYLAFAGVFWQIGVDAADRRRFVSLLRTRFA